MFPVNETFKNKNIIFLSERKILSIDNATYNKNIPFCNNMKYIIRGSPWGKSERSLTYKNRTLQRKNIGKKDISFSKGKT